VQRFCGRGLQRGEGFRAVELDVLRCGGGDSDAGGDGGAFVEGGDVRLGGDGEAIGVFAVWGNILSAAMLAM
jgi:hypothetical protein